MKKVAKKIKIPDFPYFEQEVTLGGETYNLLFKYNTSDRSWYITVRNGDRTTIEPLAGLKVMPNQNITKARRDVGDMVGGDLWCFRRKRTVNPLSRNNFGIGEAYELWWLRDSEQVEINIDGVIQL